MKRNVVMETLEDRQLFAWYGLDLGDPYNAQTPCAPDDGRCQMLQTQVRGYPFIEHTDFNIEAETAWDAIRDGIGGALAVCQEDGAAEIPLDGNLDSPCGSDGPDVVYDDWEHTYFFPEDLASGPGMQDGAFAVDLEAFPGGWAGEMMFEGLYALTGGGEWDEMRWPITVYRTPKMHVEVVNNIGDEATGVPVVMRIVADFPVWWDTHVFFKLGGQASPNADYTAQGADRFGFELNIFSARIPAGRIATEIRMVPTRDEFWNEADETIILDLLPDRLAEPGQRPSYELATAVGTSTRGVGRIMNEPDPNAEALAFSTATTASVFAFEEAPRRLRYQPPERVFA